MSRFADWQPVYAAHGLATFPVRIEGRNKKPMAKNYLRAGRPYSDRLAKLFPDADAFGFALGARTKITVLDCDSDDDRILADAMARHGQTPLIVRSGSGNYQAWYRHNGERRHIRPDPRLPVDILGGGFVVAPPSRGTKSNYQIIAGTLDDLDRLPLLQNFVAETNAEVVSAGRRNNALWEHCMRQCRSCDDFATLLDVAETFNSHSLNPPLSADEVLKAARSAWSATERGQNRFGQIGAFLALEETLEMSGDPHLLTLLAWLRAQNSPTAKFLIADGLATRLGWSLPQLRRCRKALLEMGKYEMIRPPVRGCAALYRWPQSGNGLSKSVGHAIADRQPYPKGCRGSVIEDSLSISIGHCQTGSAPSRRAA
ncbi:bifunctional DNA primase/polymerase [Bradyrhizobium manausense]|uniref:bifunctional DNA primase/polymerase n=1 Tax=Bradyrhizobium manausense TaxID=989370 RepID=UPI001BACDE20|nr:bifunctional DNA primase/polymerase [Bradyrhizobium manausense]MBR0685294.1 bifunctional DNA primase/polymerase [Bradyrhizobium manausense]